MLPQCPCIATGPIQHEEGNSVRVETPDGIAPLTLRRMGFPGPELLVLNDRHESILAPTPLKVVIRSFRDCPMRRRVSLSHYSHFNSLSSLKLAPTLLQLIPPTRTHLSSLLVLPLPPPNSYGTPTLSSSSTSRRSPSPITLK